MVVASILVIMTIQTLAGRLRSARRLRDMSASALDRAAGLSRGHTYQIESGRKPNIEIRTAASLANALDVSLDWLVSGVGEGPQAKDAA